MSTPNFPQVFRGYDPAQVDHHLAQLGQRLGELQAAADAARDEAARASVELTKVKQTHDQEAARLGQALDSERSKVSALEEAGRTASTPTFADLGQRVGSILTLADEEATQIRATALQESEAARAAADAHAEQTRAEAARYAEETRSRTDLDAANLMDQTRAKADSIIEDAAREAAARREEAEAFFENHRAKVASQAADFESTLTQRRDLAAAEFATQLSKNEEHLADIQARADQLAKEASERHAEKTARARSVLDQAQAEAGSIIEAAKEQAERVRRDSDRELAAATARRDSITAQLSNVRNMLATLGAPGVALSTAHDEDHEEPAGAGSDAEKAQEDTEPVAEEAQDESGGHEAQDEAHEGDHESADQGEPAHH